MQQKEISKADMKRKVEAWQTLYKVALSGQDAYMRRLDELLAEKESLREKMFTKITTEGSIPDENASYLILVGYIECLKDILKKAK